MPMKEWEIGESAYLKEPVKGYRYVEIVDYDCTSLVVETTSGMRLTVYADELTDA